MKRIIKFFTLKKYLSFDLGTDTTRIYLKGKGLVVNEPSIVAFNNRTNRVVAVGFQAKKMFSRTPVHISAIRPIVHGIIADFDLTKEMVSYFLKNKSLDLTFVFEVVVSVPTNLTEVEKKSFEDLLKEVGARRVYLIDQPLAAALGSRLDINQPSAYLLVDIGAGFTDMAVVSLNGVVVSKRLKIAGDYFNQEIIKAVKEEFKLVIGEPTAEEIKVSIGSVIPLEQKLEVVVRGRDVVSGLPREILLKDHHVRSWFQPSLKRIIEGIKELIESTPPELVGDIYKNGIFICGGGSLLRGIDHLLQKELGVLVRIVEDPLNCVVRGAGLITEKFEEYKSLLESFTFEK